jgi:hypothetical protein
MLFVVSTPKSSLWFGMGKYVPVFAYIMCAIHLNFAFTIAQNIIAYFA